MEDVNPSSNKDLFKINEKHMDNEFNELISFLEDDLVNKLILVRQNCQEFFKSGKEKGSEHWKVARWDYDNLPNPVFFDPYDHLNDLLKSHIKSKSVEEKKKLYPRKRAIKEWPKLLQVLRILILEAKKKNAKKYIEKWNSTINRTNLGIELWFPDEAFQADLVKNKIINTYWRKLNYEENLKEAIKLFNKLPKKLK